MSFASAVAAKSAANLRRYSVGIRPGAGSQRSQERPFSTSALGPDAAGMAARPRGIGVGPRSPCRRLARRPAQRGGECVQRGMLDSVVRPLPTLFAGDEAGFDELLEMVGDRRLSEADRVDEITHARLAVGLRSD